MLTPCIKTENAIIYPTENIVVVEGVPVSEMLNRSFYEVFENGDKKWLVTYADVALNGNKHILQDYSAEVLDFFKGFRILNYPLFFRTRQILPAPLLSNSSIIQQNISSLSAVFGLFTEVFVPLAFSFFSVFTASGCSSLAAPVQAV